MTILIGCGNVNLRNIGMKSGIYQIINLVNFKFYVGSSVDFGDRWYKHDSRLENNNHENQYLQNAFNKYGSGNFVYDILEFVDEGALKEREQYYLDTLQPWRPEIGYNISKDATASMRGRKHTEETKKKISISNLGKHSLFGEDNPMFEKHHSEQSKNKQSIAAFKRPSPSPRTRKKWSEQRSGKGNPMYGKSRPDTKERMLKNNIIYFPGVIEKIIKSKSGEKSYTSKLKWNDIPKIKELYENGEHTHRSLALLFNVGKSTIGYILSGKTWKEENK